MLSGHVFTIELILKGQPLRGKFYMLIICLLILVRAIQGGSVVGHNKIKNV